MKKSKLNQAQIQTKTTVPTSLVLSHNVISERAASLWVQRGRPEGQDQEIWLEAEKQLARSRFDFDKEGGNDELDALFPGEGRATTSL